MVSLKKRYIPTMKAIKTLMTMIMTEFQNGNDPIIADLVTEHKKERINVVMIVKRLKWRIIRRDGALDPLGSLNNVGERELMDRKRKRHWIEERDAMWRDICRLNGVREISILHLDMGSVINTEHSTILVHFKEGVLILHTPFIISVLERN